MARPALMLLASLLALPAAAELLEIDLAAPGDGLVTRDTATALDWLDLTESAGLSFADVEAGAGGFTADGWRYATEAEVCSFAHLNVSRLVSPTGCAPLDADFISPAESAAVQVVLELIGVTDVVVDPFLQTVVLLSTGLYDDGDARSGVGVAEMRGCRRPSTRTPELRVQLRQRRHIVGERTGHAR